MKAELESFIVRLLNKHRIMTIASKRPDGWPQANVVCYVNDRLVLYCFISRLSHKYANIAGDPRVSISIAGDVSNPLEIRGLSLAARVALVEDKTEFDRICTMMLERFPQYGPPSPDHWVPWHVPPNPAMVALLRITPEIISVIDYSTGFGHSDLVTVSEGHLQGHVESRRHNWLGSNAV